MRTKREFDCGWLKMAFFFGCMQSTCYAIWRIEASTNHYH